MGASQRLRFRDVRAVFHLLGETLEQWDDPDAWHTHFLGGLCELVGGGRGGWSHVRIRSRLEASALAGPAPSWDAGWSNIRELRVFRGSIDAIMRDPDCTPTMRPALARLAARPPLVTCLRRALVPDRQWHRSAFYEEHCAPCRCGDFILTAGLIRPIGALSIFCVDRPDDPHFLERRQVRLVHLAHRELVPLIGTRLTVPGQLGRAGLTRRQREVLDHLLAGRSEAEIGRRLYRSPATIHEHILAIYRHFQVETRAELLSYLLSRRPRGNAVDAQRK